MAITRIATSSLKTLNKYDSFLGGNTAYIPVSYDSIATVSVGAGGSSTVSFTSIPSTYKHLQIRGIARTNRSSLLDGVGVQLNSDTGTNYGYHTLLGSGASAVVDVALSLTKMTAAIVAGNTATSGAMGIFVADILDYTNTSKYKTMKSLGGYDANGNGYSSFYSGLWRNTSAITSITLSSTDATGLLQYSSFGLYGIKGE